MIGLTRSATKPVHIAPVMSSTDWLRKQIERLETEMRDDPIFETDVPPTPQEIRELRAKVVVHTYLKQQLQRREAARVRAAKRSLYDTQELVLMHR